MVGPYWPGPKKGPVKSRPGALDAPAAWRTVSTGGCRLGCERKLCTSAGVPGVEGNPLSGMVAGGAIVKAVDSLRVCPCDGCHLACTVTCSPGLKGLLGL